MSAGSFANLTLTVKKVSALAANDVVVAFVDEFNRGRYFRPDLMTLVPTSTTGPQAGDAANVWLPYVVTSHPGAGPDRRLDRAVQGRHQAGLQ